MFFSTFLIQNNVYTITIDYVAFAIQSEKDNASLQALSNGK